VSAAAAADLYSRCPDCGFIALPDSMEYTLTRDGDSIDWARPVHVRCMICRAPHVISADDVLHADGEMTCKRCGATAAYPVGAARVQCPGCGLFLLGPDLTAAQRDELAVTERLAGLALRESYLAAKERSAGRRGAGDATA
jgi:ribosomal protein S27E